MTNLPNSIDNFQRVINNDYQANTHKDLHNSLAETLEAVQKYSGSIHVNSLPAESEVGVVYVLKEVDGNNQPGFYLCITDDPTYLCLSSRGEGYVRYYDITDQTIVDIEHGLNTIGVLVNALDSSMNQVEYDELTIIDENNIRILFTESFTGKIIVFSSGRDGLSPEHEWDGPRLRFKNPNGSWGEWVDLSGVAPGGPIGPMPEHEWDGTQIRFQLPGGSWGPLVDLRGIQGLTGSTPGHEWDGSSIRFRNPDGTWGSFVDLSGPEGPGVVWKGTFSLLNTYNINVLVKYGRSVYLCTVDGTTNILPSVTNNWDLYCEGGQDGSGAGSNLVELEAGEDIDCEQILTTSFAGTGNENLKVGSNIELTKAYRKSLLGFELYIKKEGNPIGPTYIKIYDVVDGVRAEEPIKTWTLLADIVTTSFQYFRYMFDENTLLTGDKDIVLSTIAGNDDNYFVVNIEEYHEVLLSAAPVFVGSDGKLYLSQIAPARQRFNGMCFTPVVAGQLGTMTMFGLQDSLRELIVGSDYYISETLGQISTEFSAIKVGSAVSDQEILMEKQTNFVNSSSSDLITIDENGINLNVIDPDNPVAQSPAQLIGGTLNSLEVDVLLVGGGGGSNTSYYGGGGGAGGLILKEGKTIIGGGSVVVGAGGTTSDEQYDAGGQGGNTVFDGMTALGGGGGGCRDDNGLSGGSGGGNGKFYGGPIWGGAGLQPSQVGDSVGFGNNGGYNRYNGGGGGGAGSAGSGTTPGDGMTIWGKTYASGGGSGLVANSGNGGKMSVGSDGVCVIRYRTANAVGKTITGGTITTEGEYTYHTFTSNGFFSVDNLYNFKTLEAGTNDGKFSVNIDGVNYNDITVDLTGIQSFSDIATKVQSAIRTATSSTETVVWSTDKFIITSAYEGRDSQVLKLTAPTTGTDISGAGYLDLGENATEIAGDGDDYKLVMTGNDGKIGGGYLPGLFGDGSDGDIIISSSTSLARDMYYNTLIINDGVILNSNGYRIFVKEYTRFNGTGKIASNGGDGNDGGRGGNTYHSGYPGYVPSGERNNGKAGGIPAYSSGTLPIPKAGGNGGNGGNSSSVGSNGSKIDSLLSIGVASSAGGSGGSSQGGGAGSNAGGTSAAGTITNAVNRPRTVMQALNLFDLNGTAISQLTASAGGGGGGGGGGWYNNSSYSFLGGGGGGAGGSGGVLLFFSRNIYTSENNIFLQARGGNGGNGGNGYGSTTGAGGGGAGGSGGCIIVFGNIVGNGLMDVSGGSGGVAGEGGNVVAQNGNDGINGIIYLL